MKLTRAQNEYIERIGRWWEKGTGSRTSGRILGWLMICDPAHQSSSQLADSLQISAGSVSTQIRFMENLGMVERVTFAGDRVTYFQLKPNVWTEMMWSELDQLKDWQEMAKLGAAVRPKERPERVDHIGLIADFLLGRWPLLMQDLVDELEKEKQR
jgi:DNA-binding transcriptional regulator GbsR (MarR family)